ncbi:MAG TPA: hypothetical protein VIY96_09475, partial [Thermoanaerobaculia bacterium]
MRRLPLRFQETGIPGVDVARIASPLLRERSSDSQLFLRDALGLPRDGEPRAGDRHFPLHTTDECLDFFVAQPAPRCEAVPARSRPGSRIRQPPPGPEWDRDR